MVVHEMNRGGIENFIMNLYRTIDRNQILFDFVAHTNNQGAFDEEIEALGGTIYHCPDYRIVNHFEYSKWWKNFFKEHKEYKIVHSHLDSSANIHLRIAKKFGLATIAHSHSSSEGFGIRAIVKSVLKIGFCNCCDYKFACSTEAAKWLYGADFKEDDHSKIINNGIESKKFVFDTVVRNQIRENLGISADTYVIGHVGRMDTNKNQAFLIDVLKVLIDSKKDYKLVCVGDGVELENNKQKAKDLNLEDKIIFTGIKSNINEYLQAFDVFVMPSIYEGLPVSTIEAQATGLKCIISDAVSKECDVTSNVEFVSLQESANDWAKKIDSILPYDRENTSSKIISAGYDIEATSNWLTDFYIAL